MKLSVIIPTHNRAEILKTCLTRLENQDGVEFEVIVVDDGSTDHTEQVMREHVRTHENVAYIKQSASHQGVARNRGVMLAKGEVIVFIGDDIFVEPGFLKAHHDRHAEYDAEEVVVLGFSTWDPALKINPYMRFLESSGWQFGYQFLQPGFIEKKEPYKFFYTSNISMKREFFNREKFDEDFTFYGWEDIELGYRLWKKHGMKMYYEPEAKALHHHLVEVSNLPKKMNAVGKSAVHFERLQPDVQVIPRGIKSLVIKTAANKYTLPLCKVFGKKTYFKLRSWHEFMEGVTGER